MSFIEAVRSVFQNYATFSGRARRSEYWFFMLFNMIVTTVIGILTSIAGEKLAPILTGISGLYFLGILIPSLAVCWRRLHDTGRSGAFYFMGLIPLIGPIILLIWFCTDSDPGVNMYGPNPKEAELPSNKTSNFAYSVSDEKRFRKAKEMLRNYGFDSRAMWDDGILDRFNPWKEVPSELIDQWFEEWFEEQYSMFLQGCERGKHIYLGNIFHWHNKMDEARIMEIFHAVYDHADQIAPEDELHCWACYNSELSLASFREKLSDEEFTTIINGIKTRLDYILERTPELADEFRFTQGFYEKYGNA